MLHHVEIYVSDLKRSRDFWSWFLSSIGYELYQEWEQGFSYLFDRTYIVFVQAESRFLDLPYHRCRPGLNHLAFHANSPTQVDDMTRELELRNVPILYRDRHPHAGGSDSYAVFFEDPDRMKVEFVSSLP